MTYTVVKKSTYVTTLPTQPQGDLPISLLHTTTHKNTTTLHNNTRVHKVTNVTLVFMALILNGFEVCNIITRGIGRGGP